MKVGIVVQGGFDRSPEWGYLLYLHSLVERLARRHEVHVFSLHGDPRPARYPLLGATVHHAGVWPKKLRTFAAIVAEHGRRAFDVLHAFWVRPPGLIAAAAGMVIRRPVVLHITGGELVSLPDVPYGGMQTRRGRFWNRMTLAGASRITAASVPNVEALRALGFQGERVPLGPDLRTWPPVPPRPRLPGTPARIVHVAHLSPFKDQPTLLDAARRLAARGVDFQLDLAGRDMLHGAIQALAVQWGLADRVRFHSHLTHDRLHSLVVGADLLWHSSRYEGGPLVVLEAAIAGVPTVGTAVGHVVDWAPDAAVAVPVRDSEALARETAQLLEQEPRRMALAREAQRRALACDADWTARRFEAIYEELVSAATPGGRGR